MFALRNPAPRKPNDRKIIETDEVIHFKKYLQEDYNIRAVDLVCRFQLLLFHHTTTNN